MKMAVCGASVTKTKLHDDPVDTRQHAQDGANNRYTHVQAAATMATVVFLIFRCQGSGEDVDRRCRPDRTFWQPHASVLALTLLSVWGGLFYEHQRQGTLLCRIKIIVWLGSDIRYDALAAILRRMSDPPPGRGDQTAPNLIIR
jgi:hypothetical protein